MTSAEENEITDWVSDQSWLHMRQGSEIDHLMDGLLRNTDKLVDGTTKAQVDDMTQFKKIELLERLYQHPQMIGHPMLRELGQFVREIQLHKDGFRTADDFEN